jgi:hypothetical protein
MTIQELLTQIRSKGLNDYDISRELKNTAPTSQGLIWRLRNPGSKLGQKRTNHDRHVAIENLYNKILGGEK